MACVGSRAITSRLIITHVRSPLHNTAKGLVYGERRNKSLGCHIPKSIKSIIANLEAVKRKLAALQLTANDVKVRAGKSTRGQFAANNRLLICVFKHAAQRVRFGFFLHLLNVGCS
jgi:hypothetical protein